MPLFDINLQGRQRVVDGIMVCFDSDINIISSNTNLLPGDVRPLLSGRCVEISIYPFPFHDYLSLNEIDEASCNVDLAYAEYEGFPAVTIAEEAF